MLYNSSNFPNVKWFIFDKPIRPKTAQVPCPKTVSIDCSRPKVETVYFDSARKITVRSTMRESKQRRRKEIALEETYTTTRLQILRGRDTSSLINSWEIKLPHQLIALRGFWKSARNTSKAATYDLRTSLKSWVHSNKEGGQRQHLQPSNSSRPTTFCLPQMLH